MIRFGILAGVSTDVQAVDDKASIPDQIATCRRAIVQLGGEEVACYIMDGYSRSGYDSLADAMADIPPLRDAIEAAERGEYDVLILDNFDRLGDLGPLVGTRFRKYRKQLYSARQSGRLHDPETYDPYSDESSDINMHLEGIIQRYRINKIRRGWAAGMPKRVERGLTPLRVPFGYKWVNKKEPPVLDPQRAALVQQMKDLLLKGRSLHAIARHAEASGIPAPNGGSRWDISTIRYILVNPFYAGIVGIYRSKYIYDPTRKTKKRPVQQPRSKWVEGRGKHEPLWDEATHHQLVKEMERRHQANANFAARFPLSGLLTCAVCGQKLHRRSHGGTGHRRKVWSCHAGPSHVIIPYEEGMDLAIGELVRQLQNEPVQPADPARDVDHTEALLAQLAEERRRVQAGYKSGIFSEAEAAEEIARINHRMEEVEKQAEERVVAAGLREEFSEQFEGNIEALPAWVRSDDPQIVNRLISALIETFRIHPDRRVEIVWRS